MQFWISSNVSDCHSPGCCLPDPSSNRDCEAETTSRSCFSWPRCCQIHNQLRGPTHIAFSYFFCTLFFNFLTGILGVVPGLLHHPCQGNPLLSHSVSPLGVLEEAAGHSHRPGTKNQIASDPKTETVGSSQALASLIVWCCCRWVFCCSNHTP